MQPTDLNSYFRAQQISPQWAPFLAALGEALAREAGPTELLQVFRVVGRELANRDSERWAGTATLEQLAQALNARWLEMQWGWVDLAEQPDGIEILHHAAPLAAAFGDKALEWTSGILEGYYETVFHALGAAPGTTATAIEALAGGLDLRLRFGAPRT